MTSLLIHHTFTNYHVSVKIFRDLLLLIQTHGIAKLIEVQKNLKYFQWDDDLDDEDGFTAEDFYEEIFLALEKNKDTLNHFVTSFMGISYNYAFLHKLLPKLCNLKTLELPPNIYSIKTVGLP